MSLHPWQRYQALSLHVPTLSLLVDLSKTSLMDDALHRDPLLTTAFPAAFAAMEALEAGAIANPDENRRVGHYWLRAPERAPDAETAEAIRGTLTRIKDFAEAVHAGRLAPQKASRFTNLLVVGIGGSALGPQFVADALGSPRDPLRPFFFDNTDPDGMARELSRIAATEDGLPATLTVVISKSGGTKETRNGMLEAADAYRRAGLDFARHAVAVTGAQSELDEVAARGNWLSRFPMWDWVGGRTSELSAVGLLPAALQGLDVDGLLAGAAACDAAIAAHQNGALGKVTFLSSSMVYENADCFPSREGQQFLVPPPATAYGFQKLAVEYFARAAWQQHRLPFTIVRPFNCVGVGETRSVLDHRAGPGEVRLASSHVVPDLVHRVLTGQDPLRLLALGRTSPAKGLDTIVEAAKKYR